MHRFWKMELVCSLCSALGHPLHYLYFEFQYCVNLKTQSETGHGHTDVIALLRAMNLLVLVQTELSPIPAQSSAGAISILREEVALARDGVMGQLPSLRTVYSHVRPVSFIAFPHVLYMPDWFKDGSCVEEENRQTGWKKNLLEILFNSLQISRIFCPQIKRR